jgi:lysophospholipase L1-like esterase
MHRSSLKILLVAGVALGLASACGQSSQAGSGTGGSSGRGGTVGSGGSSTSGSGGQASGGQDTGRGGDAGSGGFGTGGLGSGVTTGGATGTAGATETGGSSGGKGGTPVTGGTTGMGGLAATGGRTATAPSGGATSGTGGTSPSGGSSGRNDAGDAAPTDGARPDGGADGRSDGVSGGAIGTGGAAGSGGAGGAGGDGGVDPTKKIKVWLAGDSTMMNCSGACPCGWGSQFQALFTSNATVVNDAVGGRSIQTWLYDPNVTSTTDASGECVIDPKTYSTRWQDMIDATNGMKPGDYLFIEFGINDGDSTCPRHVGTALFQSYLGTMAQAALKLGAQPIFLTSTSAIACSGSTAQANRGFGPQTKAAGTANNVPVIDLTALSAQLYTSLGLCPNSSDYTSNTSAVGKFFCDDHTHFETAGAAQIASVVAKALKDQGIGLAAYLK